MTKLEQSVTSSHLHTHRTSNQPHPLLKLPSSPSVPSPSRKYPNFSSPAILQHVLLTQSPLTFSKQSLPHSYRHSHTLSTHLSTLASSPQRFKQARVTPLLKNYIKHFCFRKLQTCLSPSIRSENTRTSCLQPALIVSFTVQKTGC